jgi:FAD/FMN-containing dehydrogenase
MTSITHRSSGYDLKQLFIGAEGTLGVVTGMSILTPPAPQAVNNVILALPTFDNVLPLFKLARRHLSEILSAFEYIDRTAYELAVKHGQGKGLSDEEIEGAECFVLLETSGGRKEHDEEVCVCSCSSPAAEHLINDLLRRNSTSSSKHFSSPNSP